MSNQLNDMLEAAYVRVANEIRMNAYREIYDLIVYLQKLGYTDTGIVKRLLQIKEIGTVKSKDDKRRRK